MNATMPCHTANGEKTSKAVDYAFLKCKKEEEKAFLLPWIFSIKCKSELQYEGILTNFQHILILNNTCAIIQQGTNNLRL